MQPWFRWFRIRLLGTAWSNVLVGYWLAGGAATTDALASAVLPMLGLTTALYCFGMGLNDYCDRHRDRDLYPDRPLPSGAIPEKRALSALVVLLGLAVVILAATPIWHGATAVATSIIVGCIVGYNAFLKDHWLLGPVSMGLVRGALLCLGATVANPVLSDVPQATAWLTGYVGLVTALSLLEERGTAAGRKLRHGVIVAWVLLFAIASHVEAETVTAFGVTAWTAAILWCCFYAGAPLSGGAPGLTTFRLLLGLFLLDLAILVTYDHVSVAAIPAVLWLIAWRPRLTPTT